VENWITDDRKIKLLIYKRGAYRISVGRPEGRRPLGSPGVDGRIILKRIFKKWDGGAWTGLCWLKIWTGGGLL
jgi:hypothetical protein